MRNQKHVIYNQDLKQFCHKLSEMVGMHFGLEWRYFRYKDSNLAKTLSCLCQL